MASEVQENNVQRMLTRTFSIMDVSVPAQIVPFPGGLLTCLCQLTHYSFDINTHKLAKYVH